MSNAPPVASDKVVASDNSLNNRDSIGKGDEAAARKAAATLVAEEALAEIKKELIARQEEAMWVAERIALAREWEEASVEEKTRQSGRK